MSESWERYEKTRSEGQKFDLGKTFDFASSGFFFMKRDTSDTRRNQLKQTHLDTQLSSQSFLSKIIEVRAAAAGLHTWTHSYYSQIHICHTLGHTVCLFLDFSLPSGIYKVRTACGIPLVHTSPIYSHIKYVILFSVFPSSFSHILNPNLHVNSDQLTCVRIPTYLSSFAQTHTCIDLYIHLLSRCTSGFILID